MSACPCVIIIHSVLVVQTAASQHLIHVLTHLLLAISPSFPLWIALQVDLN